jgi:hypothetical protein
MMKTAQRPAYAGKPPYGKSPAAGLLLNFSPLEFDDAEVDAGVFSYGTDGDEVLRKLWQEHWSTHVFRRHGPDEIAAVPVVADAPKLGTDPKKIRLKDNLGLTASLIRNSLINYLAGLPRPVLNYDPIRFVAQEDTGFSPSCLKPAPGPPASSDQGSPLRSDKRENHAPLTARTARRPAQLGTAFAFYAPLCASPLLAPAF